ncbi:3-deoxy-manno-octulosonate cytidylyltransferase [Sulfurospirillum diekertiae]|uniref:3-deoxy-manno-octulosonate cytidylyltransferase n=1 Tax=Sulfurospirillum diekertiae TaxID=1854492 RepID=A0A6G9VRA9_9BACT|nr:3-deoxy-manno-octulosonate cytidylyltransferase [Sulfurospirillum diekertiae]QIR74888.1 3-deoxy-manno-octulosonate cytidylyltransferase [Sulfurospirillum diekertiae]QIR77554.1 3-deoxy-manno-octulosonate cytidylyltransferase [Sulfurospirillum diekertiae]
MIIIPARLASTRFPGKILANIHGLPMVIATAKRVQNLDDVAIAADTEEVVQLASDYGFKAILTSQDHQSGTDRINEAASKLNLSENEIIVNVQADEPFIEEAVVKSVIERAKNTDAMITSACKKIDLNHVKDPNLVKVILDINKNAIYFSRSVIPYDREGGFEGYFGHIGLYAFRKKALQTFCTLPYAPLEHIEKLEQLRAIYHGYTIAMVEVESQSFGIDTQEDLERALHFFQ